MFWGLLRINRYNYNCDYNILTKEREDYNINNDFHKINLNENKNQNVDNSFKEDIMMRLSSEKQFNNEKENFSRIIDILDKLPNEKKEEIINNYSIFYYKVDELIKCLNRNNQLE